MDCSLSCSSVHGILQARLLEWAAFSRGSLQPRDQTRVSSTGRQILYHLSHWGIVYVTRVETTFKETTFISYSRKLVRPKGRNTFLKYTHIMLSKSWVYCVLSRAQLFEIPWIVAHQVHMFMGFSR